MSLRSMKALFLQFSPKRNQFGFFFLFMITCLLLLSVPSGNYSSQASLWQVRPGLGCLHCVQDQQHASLNGENQHQLPFLMGLAKQFPKFSWARWIKHWRPSTSRKADFSHMLSLDNPSNPNSELPFAEHLSLAQST